MSRDCFAEGLPDKSFGGSVIPQLAAAAALAVAAATPGGPGTGIRPFSEQELSVMSKPVPKIKTIQRMSKIGGGAFGTTYGKRV